MKELVFVQLKKQCEEHYHLLNSLMTSYIAELDQNHHRATSSEFISRWIKSIIEIQGDYDRHLEFCYDGELLIGFLYGKIDHTEHKGFIKPGYGYIMEFYVKPEYRRQGYGRAMFFHLEKLFAHNGVKRMYLTSDPITGIPFWKSMGFIDSNKKSPENDLEIYEKEIDIIRNKTIKAIPYAVSSHSANNPKENILKEKFNVIPLANDHLSFICNLLNDPSNISNLHLKKVPSNEYLQFYEEMKESLLHSSPGDEQNYIIRSAETPIAWLKLNGFTEHSLWISMLVVHHQYRSMGAGTYALKFTEDYTTATNRRYIYIHTSQDNTAALSLYQKAGYCEISQTMGQNEDQTVTTRYTLRKTLW